MDDAESLEPNLAKIQHVREFEDHKKPSEETAKQ